VKLTTPKKRTLIIAAVLLVVGAVLGNHYLQQSRLLPDGLIQTNGRIEGDSIIIASRQPGRIIEVLAREGDSIESDQVLVRLDDTAAQARFAQAVAARDVAAAQTDQCQAELDLLSEQVPYEIEAAEAAVTAAEAEVEQARAAESQARRERERYWALAETGSVGMESGEQADLRWRQSRDQVTSAEAHLEQARQTLNDAQLGPMRITAKEAELAVLEASARAAEARLEEAQSVLNDLTVTAPAAGVVTVRLADLGEVVNAGTPLHELVDLEKLYLEVFIPEVEIGKVRLGLPAQIYTDAFPEQPFPAEVRYIASRAEFTPKEIQTPDERTKLVYAVKLYLDENPDHRLTPGLPADAVIRWMEDAPWVKPRW